MATKKQDTNENHLDEVLNIIYRVCKSKGWNAHLSSKDLQTFKYASVEINKSFSKGFSEETVTGSIEIDVIYLKEIKFRIHKISFYGHSLETLSSALRTELNEIEWYKALKPTLIKEDKNSGVEIIENILQRFDRLVRQLKRRHDDRSTISVDDEYDVQDLLHSVLRCHFDDVRPEDYTPSYAGSCSRVDFVLKKEQIIIEVKYASDKLKDKKVGEQLIIDIKRYETHPDCKTLFCFVYDPNGNIKNPIALENDLTGLHGKNNLKVKVIISPK